jgi:hypothetical protein
MADRLLHLQLIVPFLENQVGKYSHLQFYRKLCSLWGITFEINECEVSIMKIEYEILLSVSGANVRIFVELLSDIQLIRIQHFMRQAYCRLLSFSSLMHEILLYSEDVSVRSLFESHRWPNHILPCLLTFLLRNLYCVDLHSTGTSIIYFSVSFIMIHT